MLPSKQVQDRILLTVAIAAAGFIQISIAASQVLLGAGTLLLLIFRQKLKFPRIWVPLACLFIWTALADVVSPDPWLGRAQIKKFFVFLFIPLVYGVFAEQFPKIFYLMMAWAAGATASASLALFQFIRSAHVSYISYVGKRITGFESHWMTFGGLQLSVLLLLLAQLFFSNRRLPLWAYSSVAIIGTAILLGGTRSIWLAAVPAVIYLVWIWRPRMILVVPVLVAAGFLSAPHNVKERLLSLAHPQEDVDSNRHRVVTFRTGLEMIKAHPWFGLGPEEISRNFDAYVPKDVDRPLPIGYYGHLHNIYVQYAAERGIPGLLCVMWFVVLTLYDCSRARFSQPRQERSQEVFILHGTVAVTIGILVGGMFEYNLGDSEVLMMFCSVVALGYAAIENTRTNALPDHAPNIMIDRARLPYPAS
ncbi:MAG: O-antigen ligase family protein [Acidobacteriaceae bacterium]|nr:O-antigen ligase family protein [Acidobacteriaceae bacterium]